jgi:hypothetical protein
MEGIKMILVEAVEMGFAFIGVIWTMQLVASLINRKPEENICNEKYYIGVIELTSKRDNSVVTIINLYMKELPDGRSRRTYVARPVEGWDKAFEGSSFKKELDAWAEGGKFPNKFSPVEPLGEMLNRMMKKKMGIADV